MSETASLAAITDRTLSDLVASPRAVLVLGKSDCGHCTAYEREILELQAKGELEGVEFGKLLLDAPGSPRFKKENPWIASLEALPYTLLFSEGQLTTHFATSRASYLAERLEEDFASTAG